LKIDTPTRIIKLYEHHKSVLSEHLDFWGQIAKISSPVAIRNIEETGEEIRRVKAGQRRDIFNDTIVDAKNIAVSGLMAGMTPRETPWFNTGIAQNGELLSLNTIGVDIKSLIDQRTEVLRLALYKSNFYSTLTEFYQDALNYGNAGVLMDEHPDLNGQLIYEYVPLGTYVVIEDGYGRVKGFIRRLAMTTYQIVDRFLRDGDDINWDLAPEDIKRKFENDQWYDSHTVFHSILPQTGSKPFESCYFMKENHRDKFLSQKEYSYMPFYFFRWSKRQGEPYANDCPGMQVFHTNEYMQHLEKGLMSGYKQKADPTLKVTTGIDLGDYNRKRHGGVVYVDDWDNDRLEPLFGGMMYPYTECERKIERLEARIRQAYFNNMFMAFLQAPNIERTREEIIRKYEEKLVQLNPVMGRLMTDFLNPMLNDAAMVLERANRIPKVTEIKQIIEELEGMEGESVELVPVYTSLVMMAMQSLGMESVNQFFSAVGALDQLAQDPISRSIDWVDRDAFVLWKAEKDNVPTEILNTEAMVTEIREGRAQAMQQQQQMEMQQQQAQMQAQMAQALTRTQG
jgi:hypothetical protein